MTRLPGYDDRTDPDGPGPAHDAAELLDPVAWPVLFADPRPAVVYRNLAEDEGQDYLLVPGDGRPCVTLATGGGMRPGPAMSWVQADRAWQPPPPAVRRAPLRPVGHSPSCATKAPAGA